MSTLAAWSAAHFGLARPVTCRLLRAYTNDVYAMRSLQGRFVLKVYGHGWRTEPEIRYELALVRHLSAAGLRVPLPIAGCNGDAVQEIEMAGGRRHAVLYAYAPGRKPRPPFTPRLYAAFGRAIARMHTVSDDFVTEHPRHPLNLRLLIDEPLALASPLFESATDREALMEIAVRVKEQVMGLASEGLDWGPVHGDATLDNLHVTADGEIVLYDFDSGGPGWRAADLQGWATNDPAYRERWDAFLAGYSALRPLRPADLLAAPYLTIAWDIWGLKIDLDHRILRQGPARSAAYLREQGALICERARMRIG